MRVNVKAPDSMKEEGFIKRHIDAEDLFFAALHNGPKAAQKYMDGLTWSQQLIVQVLKKLCILVAILLMRTGGKNGPASR